jgi:hypothetical protein
MGVQNLLYFYDLADRFDVESGRSWYWEAHNWVRQKAEEFEVSPGLVAAVLAILSPRNKWNRNLIDTENTLRAVLYGEPSLESLTVSTFKKNLAKAIRVIETNNPDLAHTSQKVSCFVHNILDPTDSTHITVDSWMIRAYRGEPHYPAEALKGKQYEKVASEIREAAEIVGLHPVEFQAVVWVAVRRLVLQGATSDVGYAQKPMFR